MLEKKVIDILARQLSIDVTQISVDSDLFIDLNISSLQIMQILSAVETQLGKTVSVDKFETVNTVSDLIHCLSEE